MKKISQLYSSNVKYVLFIILVKKYLKSIKITKQRESARIIDV